MPSDQGSPGTMASVRATWAAIGELAVFLWAGLTAIGYAFSGRWPEPFDGDQN